MLERFTTEEYKAAKSTHLLELECTHCHSRFFRMKKYVTHAYKKVALGKNDSLLYCNNTCAHANLIKAITKPCAICGALVTRQQKEIRKHKGDNFFCGKSCSATYHNTHKTQGFRRSKCELWLEAALTKLFPELNIQFNNTKILGFELDIYFPDLSLGFEIQGIYHSKPIFGEERFKKVQARDMKKKNECIAHNIQLICIDIAHINCWKPIEGIPILKQIVTNICALL